MQTLVQRKANIFAHREFCLCSIGVPSQDILPLDGMDVGSRKIWIFIDVVFFRGLPPGALLAHSRSTAFPSIALTDAGLHPTMGRPGLESN